MRMETLNVFLDTNIVKVINSNMIKFELNETYKVLKSFITENDLQNVKIFIPRIVIEELVTQYIEEYKETTRKINEDINKMQINLNKVNWGINLMKNFDISNRGYISYIKNASEEFIEQEKPFLNVVEFPSSSKLEKIVKRSLNKKKPFFGGHCNGKKFSDAGFKDVIFFESIVEQLEKIEGEYLIISKDKYLSEIILENEIVDRNGRIIELHTGKEIVKYLEGLFGIEDFSKYIKFSKSDYYIETVEHALNCRIVKNLISLQKREDNDILFIDNLTLIEIDGVKKEVIVRLSEENDFLEILDKETEEVIYEWKD